jgi:CheY-like chemotaxis protein
MPVMKGPEATSRIRALGYTGPVIGVTGNATQADYDIFMQAGATEVLTKPVDMCLLWQALESTQQQEE